MKHKSFLRNDILEMDTWYRSNFMNSVEGLKSLVLIGSQNSKGITNVAPFNSLVHISATPPRIGFIHRPATVPKQTFTNIQVGGFFTMNLVTENLIEAAHQSSARYSTENSEFDAIDLTPEYTSFAAVPYVKESPVKFGMSLEEIVPLKASGGFLIIGNVEEVHFPEEYIMPDGHISYGQAGLAAVVGLDAYYSCSFLKRKPRAKKP